MLPLISAIVATKNEEKNIRRCLTSILDQKYPKEKIEIIVVDNDSSDKTREIAGKYTNLIYDIKEESDLTAVKNFRGAQLNLGVEKSQGEIIFFPDADMTFNPELLSDAAQKTGNKDALFVPEIICGRGFFGKIRNFERSFYNETCIDGVRFVKKEVFLSVEGFDVKNIAFGPDDWDFTKKLKMKNYKLGITEESLFHHEEHMTAKTYLNKKSKYAVTIDDYVKKWGRNDPDIKKQFGLYYRYFGIFWEEGKWKKLLAHPILALGMYSLRIIVGFKFLMRNKLI